MSTAAKVRRQPAKKAGFPASLKRPARQRRLTLQELMRHPAFGMWKDKTITVEEEIRQWRKPRYGLG